MKLKYYPDTDSPYIDLRDVPSVDSREFGPGIVMDFDRNGQLVGIDIQHASEAVNLSRLDAEALPITSVSVSG